MENTDYYTTKEVAERLGVSISTLRRLCSAGLVPQVKRNYLGHRMFADWQINHMKLMLGLRKAGLKRLELRRYSGLSREGEGTLATRKAILETQKRQLWQELEDIQASIDFLERQIELIDQELAQTDLSGGRSELG